MTGLIGIDERVLKQMDIAAAEQLILGLRHILWLQDQITSTEERIKRFWSLGRRAQTIRNELHSVLTRMHAEDTQDPRMDTAE